MEAKRVLANRYELIRKIGSGGMAVVYQAYDTALDRQVAVKLLRDEYVDDLILSAAFKRRRRQLPGCLTKILSISMISRKVTD